MFRFVLKELVKAVSAYSKSFRRPALYPDNYVFDENKSVKWNRDKVEQANQSLLDNHNKLAVETTDKLQKVRDKLYDMIQKELVKKVSRSTLEKIFTYVDMNNDGESESVTSYALEETIELINLVIKDNGEN